VVVFCIFSPPLHLSEQATAIRERRETSECFNTNEGDGQLLPLGLRLAMLKIPALALARTISRGLRTRPGAGRFAPGLNGFPGLNVDGYFFPR
jgi:hypothetical protein